MSDFQIVFCISLALFFGFGFVLGETFIRAVREEKCPFLIAFIGIFVVTMILTDYWTMLVGRHMNTEDLIFPLHLALIAGLFKDQFIKFFTIFFSNLRSAS
jgi:hypothetical protein